MQTLKAISIFTLALTTLSLVALAQSPKGTPLKDGESRIIDSKEPDGRRVVTKRSKECVERSVFALNAALSSRTVWILGGKGRIESSEVYGPDNKLLFKETFTYLVPKNSKAA